MGVLHHLVTEGARAHPLGALDAVAAWSLAELGRVEEARRLLDGACEDGFARLDADASWPLAVAAWAEAAVGCRHARAAGALYDLLAPKHDLHSVTGGWYGGSYARLLGLLAGVLERGEATAWLARAEEDHRAVGSPTWLARSHLDWADHLAGRRDAGGANERARLALEVIGARDLTASRARAETLLAEGPAGA